MDELSINYEGEVIPQEYGGQSLRIFIWTFSIPDQPGYAQFVALAPDVDTARNALAHHPVYSEWLVVEDYMNLVAGEPGEIVEVERGWCWAIKAMGEGV